MAAPGSSKTLASVHASAGKVFSESAYQRAQRSMKASHDSSAQEPAMPLKVARFDDSLQSLAEVNRRLEKLMHKPRSQWTAEDKRLVATAKSMK
jgi:hypothetical protein